MKSYASIVSKKCSDMFTPKRIQTFNRKIASQEETMKNVIVYGLNETEGEGVRSKVEQVLADIGEKPAVRDYSRLGSQKEGVARARPIKFTVGSSDHATKITWTR